MAIISLPARFGFSELPEFGLARASSSIRSKYTGVRQSLPFPFAIWQLKGKLVELDGDDARLMRSFLVQLNGTVNKFRLPVPGYSKPSTGYNGNAQLNAAAAARASSIQLKGLTASTAIFKDGDFFTINDELKMVTGGNYSSTGGGLLTVPFDPPLRSSLATNTAVTLQNPTILMHSIDDDVAKWGIKPPFRQNSTLNAWEAIEL